MRHIMPLGKKSNLMNDLKKETTQQKLISNDIYSIRVETDLCELLPIVACPKWYKDGVFKIVQANREFILNVDFSKLQELVWLKNNERMATESKNENVLENSKVIIFINSKTKNINYLEIIESA